MTAAQWGWLGFALSTGGVAMQAFLPRAIGWSFVVFEFAAVMWLVNGLRTKNWPLTLKSSVMVLLNVAGMVHWL